MALRIFNTLGVGDIGKVFLVFIPHNDYQVNLMFIVDSVNPLTVTFVSDVPVENFPPFQQPIVNPNYNTEVIIELKGIIVDTAPLIRSMMSHTNPIEYQQQ